MAIMKVIALAISLMWVVETYGQLSTCLVELVKVLEGFQEVASQNRSAYGQMAAASGKGVNDLGIYTDCNKVSQARYLVFQFSTEPYIAIGLCGPMQCNKTDYESILQFLLNPPAPPPENLTSSLFRLPVFQAVHSTRSLQSVQISANSIQLHFSKEEIEEKWGSFDGGFYAMIVFVAVLMTICTVATIMDLKRTGLFSRAKLTQRSDLPELDPKAGSINREESVDSAATDSVSSDSQSTEPQPTPQPPAVWEKYLLCFSFYTNLIKLFTPKPAQEKNALDLFNGIRVLSIGWVVLGHCFLFRITETVVTNIDEVPERVSYWYSAFLYGGLFSVDTFFWMSGVLFAYLMIEQFRGSRGPNWGTLYLHRIVRILPLYAFIIMLMWAFSAYIGDGPIWYSFDETQTDCQNYWWTMLIFINNFYLPTNNAMTCLTGSWYLANDIQFFLVSPPIIYLYVKDSRLTGWVLTFILTVICVVFSIAIAWDLDLNVVPAASQDKYYMTDYYYKPYTRIGPYAVGLMCGMIYYSWVKKQERQEPFDAWAYAIAAHLDKNVVSRWVCYGLGLALINILVFIPYNQYQDVSWNSWTRTENTLFLGFSHTIFALGLTLFLLPVLLGHNKFVTSILSADVWTPLARMVFGIFLMHMVIGHIIFKSQPVSYFLDPLNLFIDAMSIFIFAVVITIPVVLMVESPMSGLERLLLRSGGKKH